MRPHAQRFRIAGSGEIAPIAALCPLTGVSIPECSCQRCIEEQIRHHSPALLNRRFGGRAQGDRSAGRRPRAA